MDVNPAMVQALTDNGPGLQATDGINGYDIGLDDGDNPVLRILVDDPANPPPSVPEWIGDFPVLLVEGRPMMQQTVQADHVRYEPVMGGCEVAKAATGVLAEGSGTLGCVLRDRFTLQPVGLSCAHVLAAMAPADVVPGRDVWQPNALGARAGSLLRWEMPSIPPLFGRWPSGSWDVATCSVDRSSAVGEILEIGKVTGFGSVTQLGERVRKRGRTTRLTYGEVRAMFGAYLLFEENGPHGWWMTGQLMIQAIPDPDLNPDLVFCEGGDSGSVVVNDAGEIVALLHGGAGRVGYATDFWPLAIAFNLTL